MRDFEDSDYWADEDESQQFDISLQKDAPDGAWYIHVTDKTGGSLYHGYWENSELRTVEEATAEALRGSGLVAAPHPVGCGKDWAEATELAAKILSTFKGHETVRVMNAAEDGYCMEFTDDEYWGPMGAYERWVAKQDPEWIKRNGYHAVKTFEFTETEQSMLTLARAILAARGEKA